MAGIVQLTTFDSLRLEVQNPVYETVTFKNNFGIEILLVQGVVLSFNASTGFYEATYSTIPAQANAKAICNQNISLIEIAAEIPIGIIRKGIVAESRLQWALGTDTIDTIPAGASDSFKEQLRNYGIIVVPDIYVDELDNKT